MELTNKINTFVDEQIEKTLEGIIQKISLEFNLDSDEVSKCVRGNSDEEVKVQTKPKKTTRVKKAPAEVCPAKLRDKDDVCGKKATVDFEGTMYCGIHARTAAKDAESQKEPKAPKKSSKVEKKGKSLPSKKGTLKENAAKSSERTAALVKKATKAAVLNIQTIGDRRMDVDTRILFNGMKAYGKLDKDDLESINPLDEDDIVFLEKHGIEQCPIPIRSDVEESEGEESEFEIEF